MSVYNIKMESKNELKETDVKNRTCYYFDDIIRLLDRDIEFNTILLDKKLSEEKFLNIYLFICLFVCLFVYLFIYLFIYSFIFENILIYDISCKTSTGAEPLCIKYDEIDGFIKIRDIIQNLVLFDHGWFQKICDQNRHLISGKKRDYR